MADSDDLVELTTFVEDQEDTCTLEVVPPPKASPLTSAGCTERLCLRARRTDAAGDAEQHPCPLPLSDC